MDQEERLRRARRDINMALRAPYTRVDEWFKNLAGVLSEYSDVPIVRQYLLGFRNILASDPSAVERTHFNRMFRDYADKN